MATVPHGLKETSLYFGDIYFLLAVAGAIAGLWWIWRNNARMKRKEDQESADSRAAVLKDEIQRSRSDSLKEIHTITDGFKEVRSAFEKELEAIRTNHRHDKNNNEQQHIAIKLLIDRNSDAVAGLHTRLVTQETKTGHQEDAINKLEALVREQGKETKDLIKESRDIAKGQFDEIRDTSSKQFEELARSIREARETKFKQ
jgi:uncharacterized coiled-coil protein SlyX